MKITRSAATKSLDRHCQPVPCRFMASCDAAARAGTEVAEAIKSAAPSIAAESPAAPAVQSSNPAESAAALAEPETIPVKGRSPKTGYSREEFGAA